MEGDIVMCSVITCDPPPPTHTFRPTMLLTLTDSYDYSSIHNVSTYILYTSTCVVCGVPIVECECERPYI